MECLDIDLAGLLIKTEGRLTGLIYPVLPEDGRFILIIFIFVKKVKVREKNHLNRKDQSDLL